MSDLSHFDFVIVGSGFFGAVMAERITTTVGKRVAVLERRSHVGGNSYSEIDPETGIEFHRYGSHLFHTSNLEVWRWINRFADFTNYRHRVFARHGGRTYSLPINLMTLNNFFGVDLSPAAAEAFIAEKAALEPYPQPRSLEEKAISLVGRELYEAFFKGYTAKQWETDPRSLPAETITRLPVRFNYTDFYFSDVYEGLPVDGYASLFEAILSDQRIEVFTDCDFFDVRDQIAPGTIIVYTGAIDRYFDYCYGPLGWRTLDFTLDRYPVDDYQGAAVVNYPDSATPFTRVHEFKHLHPERRNLTGRTLVMREFSRFASPDDEPYYPIATPANKALYERYAALAQQERNVLFGGRLGTYRYLDMHQAIGAALRSFERVLLPMLAEPA